MIKKLRDSGYLTRDARMKERKKYGLRGAAAAPVLEALIQDYVNAPSGAPGGFVYFT